MSVSTRDPRLDDAVFDQILASVQRPSRYIGGEWNQVVKDHGDVDLTFALAFPDVYEIGMSHLGYRILYSLINSRDDTVAERVCCPWPDMADRLREHGRPLVSLESATPLGRFDVVGFSLQYEMTFTNVLEMLDLARIPLRASARREGDPLIVVGGPVVFNVEPLADFVDLVFVGDGETLVPDFLDRLRSLKRDRADRRTVIRECAQIEGIYAPGLYSVERDPVNRLLIPQPAAGVPYPVMRRIVMDLDDHPFPDRIIVPHGEIVHDRVSVEVMRGCPVGCRFCQAGYIYRPTRERDPNQVRDTVIRSVRATGYDQFSLSSLNTGEYGSIHPVMFDLMDRFEPEKVSISLSSMHASTITPELAQQVRRVRKSGFTIAPEAGTQRMRDVINKNLSEEQILTACRLAFEAGWDHVKLYFMLGLPTETDADVDGMVDLAHEICAIGRRSRGGRTRKPLVTLSASSFIPKPETPFQWLGMERTEELYRKQHRIAERVKRGVRFKHHQCETSFLEGVFSRGDRELGRVLERAFRLGARFDGWEEQFNRRAWDDAFRAEGVDPEFYAYRDLSPEAPLPWHAVHSRVNRKWLALELRRALEQATLSVCGPTDCHGCAPFARDCVKGTVAETTGRQLRSDLPLLATPAAPGPGSPAAVERAPALPRTARGVDAELPSPETRRYRGRFSKTGRLRFLGHLDLTRLLLRALRRAGFELVYTSGFNPKPRVGFGPALAVGIASEAEYIDFETTRPLPADDSARSVNGALPDGLRFDAIVEIDAKARSLGETIAAARYRVESLADVAEARGAIDRWRERLPLEVRRKRKDGKVITFDLEREVLELASLDDGGARITLAMQRDGASIRPEEALEAILAKPSSSSIGLVREELLVNWHGRWVNPILAARAGAAVDVRRAVR
ncbi:MAG TPA: TIGR03960 family B12-binding radical SAM protein [Candidatus Polarisedimenticolaceae bacterium]|nr:TIGR03960 family B12-binding radical SAM protein [Candidatus Polarisedimenticolaceae bacterium]